MPFLAFSLFNVLGPLSVTVGAEEPTLNIERTKFPINQFYTGPRCTGDSSEERRFKPGNDDKCHKSNDRTTMWVSEDPQPEATPNKGCLVMFESDDCSEAKRDGVDWSTIDAINVDYGEKCYTIVGDKVKYNSFYANTGDCATDLRSYNIIRGPK